MQSLIQYKRLLHICCISACEGKNTNYIFQIRFQQAIPHSLFKYQVVKHQEEVKQLYKQQLEEDIFDFDNPFNSNVIRSITKYTNNPKEEINASLQQCLQRIDVVTHRAFMAFYSIHLHYQDFLNGLRQEIEANVGKQSVKNFSHSERQGINLSDYKNILARQNDSEQGLEKGTQKKEKKSDETAFENMTNLLQPLEGCQLQLMSQTQVLGFRLIRYNQSQLLYVLEQPKKTTKIKNFIKNVFRYNSSGLGYLSIHRKQQGKYIKKSSLELLAQPLSMSFVASTNMILVTTAVGVYIYLCKMESKLEQVEIFSYVQLLGCVDCANNSVRGELYLLCQAEIGQMHVYSINQEKLTKMQYRYYGPSALCYEEHHSRLYISDKEGIHVYSVVQYLDIRRLHTVKIDSLYKQLSINHGYLLCISENGFMTVIELKPPQKEKLLDVTTTIGLPQNCRNIVGSSKNKRLLVTHFHKNIVMIDTIEGPIFSLRLNLADKIQAIFSDQQTATILSVTSSGYLAVARLNPSMI